ncbi:MAG: sugar ABC transporter substrate-binding protein [Lachnospiraceae bacterium]|nr:sugar ABC transporter substrate-binding protein [Lachnospiraceae bacterium]
MKRRVVALTMITAMALGMMTGCGADSSSASASSSASGSSSASASSASGEDTYNISFIVKLTDGHFSKVMAGAQAYADEHDNVNVDILSPTSATAYDEQVNMIETSLSTDSTNGVVISPLQSDSAANLVAGTDKAIIACDTDFTSDVKSAFVGTGNKDAAKAGGKAVVEMAIANGIENPTVVILTGVQGDETHDARLEGYREGAEEAGGTVLEVQYCDGIADKAANSMEAVMQNYQDGADCVLSTNDDMAMAASKVMKDSGGEAYADTLLCGFDGNQTALEAVKEGTLAMDVAQEGYAMGYKSMEAIIAVLNGESVDSFIDSGATVVDSSNIDEYIETMKEIGVWEE